MITILKESESYTLEIEKIGAVFWLTLRENKTGMAWTLESKSKKNIESVFNDMPIEEIKDKLESWGVVPLKVYKARGNHAL